MKYKAQLALIVGLPISLGVSLIADSIDPYFLDVIINIGISIILAVSLNLVNGHTGQFSLGHAGFMSVGAFGSAVVTLRFGPPLVEMLGGASTLSEGLVFLLALIVGALGAAFFGLLVGIPSLRLKGDYLAIVTLGFNEIIRVVLQNTESTGPFGGALGLKGIEPYTTFFWTFTSVCVCVYVISSLVNSSYGRGFLAVRDDEIAAESMGVPTVRYKILAFVIGAFFAGLAGGLYAHFRTSISPEGFNFLKSFDVVVMVILGGMGSTVGVIIAAIALTILNEFLRDFDQFRMIVFAILLIVMMLLRPQGLLSPNAFQRKRTKKEEQP